ncbi:MAG: polysaccharide biosynthesis/export family protein, partial [Acidobacteriaceae bacterium]|nr:polysaccharide biosynthesis/export family protein [Acidobacteriaceae bacterium]
FKSYLLSAALLAVSATLSAAQTGPAGAGSDIAITGAVKSMDQLDNSTRINNGDQLSFRIVEDEEQPSTLLVSDAGEVEIPYAGKVQAAGKTPRELAYDVKRVLENGLYKKATVLIALERRTTQSPGTIYLTGEVSRQGPLEIPANEQLTVTTAILRAGGFSDFANRRKVKVIRKVGRTQKIYVVDVKEVLNKARGDLDFVVKPGDVIMVPARLINW